MGRVGEFCLNRAMIAGVFLCLFVRPAHAASLSIPAAAEWTWKLACVALLLVLLVGCPRRPPKAQDRAPSRPSFAEMLGLQRRKA